jgi:hypothetical protein
MLVTALLKKYTICYWIIKGNEFDAVGLYMSFQNGVRTISVCTISEFWCIIDDYITKFRQKMLSI